MADSFRNVKRVHETRFTLRKDCRIMLSRLLKRSTMRRIWRRITPVVVTSFVWSSTLATGAQAMVNQPPRPQGHVQKLSDEQMRRIVGAIHLTPTAVQPGSTYPWEGSSGDVNTGNGNKLTSIPLVG